MAGMAPCRLVVMLVRLVGKSQNAFQLVHRQGVQLLLAELGQRSPKEGIACAVGITHLAGDACHMAGLVPKAVEYAVCTQGDENQPDAVLCQLCRAAFAVSGSGEQGQLLIGHLQDIHQRQGAFIWAMASSLFFQRFAR